MVPFIAIHNNAKNQKLLKTNFRENTGQNLIFDTDSTDPLINIFTRYKIILKRSAYFFYHQPQKSEPFNDQFPKKSQKIRFLILHYSSSLNSDFSNI